MTELAQRILSASLMVPVTVFFLWQGGAYWTVFVFLASFMAAREWAGLIPDPLPTPLVIVASVLCALWPLGLLEMPLVFTSLLPFLLFIPLLSHPKSQTGEWRLGLLAVILLAFSLLSLRENYGAIITAGAIGLIALSDISAFVTGRILGGRKLCPQISPGKTVSGAIGAQCAVTLMAGFFASPMGLPLFPVLLGGFLTGLVAQTGDLAISALKRSVAIKNSSRLLPGHGGLLDRLDSHITALPFILSLLSLSDYLLS